MDVVTAFIKAIPSAAASPLALIAYLATIAAWVAIAYRVNRFRELLTRIHLLPEADRLDAIRSEIGWVEVPKGLTGEQYLQKRAQTFIFVGFLVLCAALTTVGAKALYDVYQQAARADNLIEEVLGQRSSAYMSAVNTLSNGAQMVAEAAAEIRPPMTKAELDEAVDRLVLQRLNADQINRRLADISGTGRLKRVNDVLSRAAAVVNNALNKLAECFREVQCRTSSGTLMLCNHLIQLQRSIDMANGAARRIPGVNYNMSGTAPMFGGGSMDLDFSQISANNSEYLLSVECGR